MMFYSLRFSQCGFHSSWAGSELLDFCRFAALRDRLRRKEGIFPALFRHDYAALARYARVGQNAKVVP